MKRILLAILFLYSSLLFAGITQPPGPVYGDQTGTVAAAGYVGSQVTPTNLTGVSIPASTATQVSSVLLPAGIWDVACTFTTTLATAVVTAVIVGVGSSPTAFGTANTGAFNTYTGLNSTTGSSVSSPELRVAPTTATTYYCLGFAAITSGTVTGAGFIRTTRVN